MFSMMSRNRARTRGSAGVSDCRSRSSALMAASASMEAFRRCEMVSNDWRLMACPNWRVRVRGPSAPSDQFTILMLAARATSLHLTSSAFKRAANASAEPLIGVYPNPFNRKETRKLCANG